MTRNLKSTIIEKKKKRARKKSIIEGCFSVIQSGFGDHYITPYAIALNISNSYIGLISSFSGLFGPVSQWLGSRTMEKHSRKKIVIFSVLLQSLMWLPLIALSFLFWKGILNGIIPLLFIVFFTAYVFFGNLGGAAWFSWMGDLVPERVRGRYFSKRNLILGIISLMAAVLAAFFLDFFKKNGIVLVGFSIFFFLAMVARLIARKIFKTKYEPKLKLKKGYYFSLLQFLKKAPKNNFGRFSIYRGLLGFSVSVAGPFFAVYMLRNLHFGYVTFIAVTLAQSVFSLIVIRIWGRFSDEFGNYEVMKITSILICTIPVLWFFSESPYYLALGPMFIAGISWAGFNLAAANFIYDSVTPEKRGLVLSYHNILNGIGVFIGAALGAFIVKYISFPSMNSILIVFVISSFLRALVTVIMIPKIREVREVEKLNSKRALRNIIFREVKMPSSGPQHEVIIAKKTRK